MDLSQSIPLMNNVMNHNYTVCGNLPSRSVILKPYAGYGQTAYIFKINSQFYRLGSMALKSTLVKKTDELTKTESSMILTLLF